MDYHTLPRRQLQTLCKKHGIPANATNSDMADALSALLKPKPDTSKQSDKSLSGRREPAINTPLNKAKNLESSKIQMQNTLGSVETSSTQPQRATRSRGCLTEAPALTSATFKEGNSKSSKLESSSDVQKQVTKSVSTRRRVANQDEDGLQSKPAEILSTKVESPSSERKKKPGIVLRRGRIRVRSPRTISKNSEYEESLEALKVNAKGNKTIQGDSVSPSTQSCHIETQKVQLRKNKRFVTFSDVLEVTHSFSESPSADVLTESRICSTGLEADQKNQCLVSTCEDKKLEGSRKSSTRVSRKDCIQGISTFQATEQKIRKLRGAEANKDNNIFTVSKQSTEAEKTLFNVNCGESRSRRRSICGRKVSTEEALALNGKENAADNSGKGQSHEEVPFNTRQSRRLTLIGSDINITQEKGKSGAIKEEEKVDNSVKGNIDTLSVSSTRRSRRLTILASDVDINQAKTKTTGTLQEKSNDSREGSTLVAPPKQAEGNLHAEVTRGGHRRTLAPLELNHIDMGAKNIDDQMMKTRTVGKSTHDLGTESHNPPQKHSKAKTSASISTAAEVEGNPIKPHEGHTSENVRCSRQKNSTGPTVLNSIGKKKKSSMEKVSDTVPRDVRKPDVQKTVRETRSGAWSAKSKHSFCETKVLEKGLEGEEGEITTTTDVTQETVEILLCSNGPKEDGTQCSRSRQEEFNDPAKSSKEHEDSDVSPKACSEDSSKCFVQDTVNAKGIDSIKLSSTNNIKNDGLFSTTGNKLGQSGAEGARISPCDAGLDCILRAMDARSSHVTVARHASCHPDVGISTLPVDFSIEVGSEADDLEITKKHDPLLYSASNCEHQDLVHCIKEDIAASKSSPISDCAASKQSQMSDLRVSISPAFANMRSNENVKEGKETFRSRLLALTMMNSGEGTKGCYEHISERLGSTLPIPSMITSDEDIIDNKDAPRSTSHVSPKMSSAECNLGRINNEICAIEIGSTMSDRQSSSTCLKNNMSLVQAIEQGYQFTSNDEVNKSLSIEADEVSPEELPAAGSMDTEQTAVGCNKHSTEGLGSASPISTKTTSDEGVIENKEALGSNTPVSLKMSPADGNLGRIQFAIDNDACAIEIGITRSSSLIKHCNQYTGDNEVKDSLCIEACEVATEGLLADSMDSQHFVQDGNKPTTNCLGSASPISTRTSDEGLIDNKEALRSTSPMMSSAEPGGIQSAIDNKVCAIEIDTSITKADKESSSPSTKSMCSVDITEQGTQYTSEIDVKDSLTIKAEVEAVVPEESPAGSMESPLGKYNAGETCSAKQEMSPLLTKITSKEGIIDSTETLELPVFSNVSPAEGDLDRNGTQENAIESSASVRSDTTSSSTHSANMGSDDSIEQCVQHITDVDIEADTVVKEDLPFVDAIQGSKESAPCEVADFEQEVIQAVEFSLLEGVNSKDEEKFHDHMADSLQVMSDGIQFDGVSVVVDSTATDGQVEPASCVDVSGNTVPMEVACKTKQRGPRAIYKSARKPKLSMLQDSKNSTEMGFVGRSSKEVCFMPWDQKEDADVHDYSTPDICIVEEHSSSSEESEEGDSEDMEDSFSDGEFCKFNTHVPPLSTDEDFSYSEENMYSDSGEDAAFDSDEDCFEEEEEVFSGEESYESEEVETTEELSESEDDSVDGTRRSLGSHEFSPALRSAVKLSEASICNGHFLEDAEVEHNAAYEIVLEAANGSSLFEEKVTLGQITACQSLENESNGSSLDVDATELLSNDCNSSVVADVQLATHMTCHNDNVLSPLSSLFATPPSNVKEGVNYLAESFSMDYQLSHECALAENEQQSMHKADSHTAFCELVPALEMEQEQDGEVFEVVQRESVKLSDTDQAMNDGVYQTLELAFKMDCANNDDRTEDAGSEAPENCEEVCSEALNEDFEAGKSHTDGVASDEQIEEFFGDGAADVELATTAVNCDLSAGDFLQDIIGNLGIDTTDITMGSAVANSALCEFGKQEPASVDPEDLDLCSTITCPLIEKTESNLCQPESQPELLLSDISDQSGTQLTREEQDESNIHILGSEMPECSMLICCRDSEFVHHVHVHERLVDETQAAQSPQIPQTPSAYTESEAMSAQGDELLENVLNETHNCANDLINELESACCQGIAQPPSAAAKGEFKSVEVDESLENVSNETQISLNSLTDEADALKCQEILQAQSIVAEDESLSASMDELIETVLNKAQASENHPSELTKGPAAAEISTVEISREQSLQQIDMTLMSLRKLKQMCKENDLPPTTRPVTETPSRRPNIARMSAKKETTSALLRDLPSASKRSALKALSSNIKSNTPAASARTPTAKSMQMPRNLMSIYDNNEGKSLVAPSFKAPSSSKKEFARQI